MKLWRGQPDNWTFKPSPREMTRALVGLGFVFFALAIVAYLSAPASAFTGLLGPLRRLFFDAFGTNGDVILYAGVGTALVFFGALKYRKNQ